MPPTALQLSSTTQQRTTFPTTVHRRSRANASVHTAFLISTLVRHHDVLFPSGLFFFFAVRVFLVQPSTDSVSVASEHRPGINLGGRVLPSLPTQHHNPPLPFSELVLIFLSGHERFEPTIGLGGLVPSPLRPTFYHSTAPRFPSLL